MSKVRNSAARVALCVSLALGAAGCSGGVLGGLVGTGNNPTPTYDLTAPRNFGRLGPQARGILQVDLPSALQIYDTEKIVVAPTPGEVTYLSDAQWLDRLPRLLQARMVQTFENSTRIRAVAKSSDRVSGDYLLVVDIRQFGIQAYGDVHAVVELSVKIVYQRGGRIAAGTVIGARVPTESVNGAAAAAALDQALTKVLIDTVKWTSRRI